MLQVLLFSVIQISRPKPLFKVLYGIFKIAIRLFYWLYETNKLKDKTYHYREINTTHNSIVREGKRIHRNKTGRKNSELVKIIHQLL